MVRVAYFLSGVVMFMILFIITVFASEVSEDETIIRIIVFIGVAVVVIIAYPLLTFFEAIYTKEEENEGH